MKQGKIYRGGLGSLGRELGRGAYSDARFFILLDENTFNHCLPQLVSSVGALQEAEFIEVPAGEECKSLEVAAQVWQTLLESGADRNAILVNLGGGSVCDLGGFVAAGYKRGIRHLNVPTTLLAMVDAAIGGKTAIDFGGVKNSIGHFYPPVLTAIEPAFLSTLPQQELLCGLMEMVKTAAVADGTLYNHLVSHPDLDTALITSVAGIKAAVVRTDPFDCGVRRILNFGHTFGHAVEMHSGLPHGISVGVGMLAEMYLSVRKTGLGIEVYSAYSKWLRSCVDIPHYTLADAEHMLSIIHNDKKNARASTLCVLLRALGEAVIDVEISDNEVRDALLRLGR